jgi:hypothetical protein
MSIEGYGEFNIYNNTEVHHEQPSGLIRNVSDPTFLSKNHLGFDTDAEQEIAFPPIKDWNVLNNLSEKMIDKIGPREKRIFLKSTGGWGRDRKGDIVVENRDAIRGNLFGEIHNVFVDSRISNLNLLPADKIVGQEVVRQTRKLTAQGVTSLGPYRGAYDMDDEYWYPGSDWMPYGLEVITTMADAEKFAKKHHETSIVPEIEIDGLYRGRLNE